ncbi:serum response factor homolog isoform X2 [Neocloeon triangulifer]|uniref:serum response factor homolog isoform X2 n=1 Tax=Neocloeon triangulifer TaxID=2078957 RepID=UPI00286EBC09|nr:serum response factor homolog isoform X2 [Neocloeon triangulifer]
MNHSESSSTSPRSFLNYSQCNMLPSGTSDIYHESQQMGSRKRHLEGFEASESDSLEEPATYTQPSTSTPRALSSSSGPPPNGKKTKGRVKIKMEYIDNKLRRYTTFSKRKTGIMKKAYELSTLTGTQVMLLVASETGHVYTFATRKLQPMITSEAGKALIQTCLNSPDASQPVPQAAATTGGDQRMSATGFEETELSYHIEDGEKLDSPKSCASGSDSSADSDSESFDNRLAEEKFGKLDAKHSSKQDMPENLCSVAPLVGFHNGNLVYQPPSSSVMYTAPHAGLPSGMLFAVKTEGPNSGHKSHLAIPLHLAKGGETQCSPADLSKK